MIKKHIVPEEGLQVCIAIVLAGMTMAFFDGTEFCVMGCKMDESYGAIGLQLRFKQGLNGILKNFLYLE